MDCRTHPRSYATIEMTELSVEERSSGFDGGDSRKVGTIRVTETRFRSAKLESLRREATHVCNVVEIIAI